MKSVDTKLDMQKVFEVMKNKTNRDYREHFERNLQIFIDRVAYNVSLTELAKEHNLSLSRIQGIEAKMIRQFQQIAKKMKLA